MEPTMRYRCADGVQECMVIIITLLSMGLAGDNGAPFIIAMTDIRVTLHRAIPLRSLQKLHRFSHLCPLRPTVLNHRRHARKPVPVRSTPLAATAHHRIHLKTMLVGPS